MLNIFQKAKDIFFKNSKEITINSKNEIVYWTDKGKYYHTNRNCMSLLRSSTVHEGTIVDSRKETLCANCKGH